MKTLHIRVMLVDDHAIVLEGYRRLLEKQDGFEVVAEAQDSVAAYRHCKELQPDVAVIDISMPGRGGIDLCRQLRQRDPSARIVVFTMHQGAAFARQAFQAGAKAYVTKSSPPMLLVTAIREAFAGRTFISPDVSEELARTSVEANSSALSSLSPREFEILRLLLETKSVSEIAAALNISPKTVINNHYLIKQKLAVATDIELLYLGLRERVVDPPRPD
ncbi:response regulator transcription factor [Hyphomicrobium sp.]|uniref:response regulator transcription factor n=1 Tax=Hyphomicrobium sp. TaxID=82 RepID=UPI0025C2E3F6|nr:response regulator transcription factor [Hyphomicrobium sp.]